MTDSLKNEHEFTQYYEEFKNAIFNYLLYRVSYDRDVAEDLTSEVFIKAYENFDRYDRARSFKTWIFTIAHNHLINHLMGNKKTISLDETIATEEHKLASRENRSDELHHKFTMEAIMQLVDALPDAQKQIVLLRFVNDLSNTEIADVLGKDEGAVRTALSRSIASLRNLYQKHLSTQQPTLQHE